MRIELSFMSPPRYLPHTHAHLILPSWKCSHSITGRIKIQSLHDLHEVMLLTTQPAQLFLLSGGRNGLFCFSGLLSFLDTYQMHSKALPWFYIFPLTAFKHIKKFLHFFLGKSPTDLLSALSLHYLDDSLPQNLRLPLCLLLHMSYFLCLCLSDIFLPMVECISQLISENGSTRHKSFEKVHVFPLYR